MTNQVIKMSNRWAVSGQAGRYHLRFTLNERLQHLVLMMALFTLIATGMPVRFHEVPTAELVVQWMGGNPMRATLHRAAAVLLLALSLYHLLYVLVARRGREQFRALMLSRKDFRDFWQMLHYYVGLAREKPAFGRFNYIEKFEYWAVFWGTAIMGITGLMLWFPAITMLFLPKWAIDVARVIHSYEALLAFLSILLWHFYNVHFNPAVFPMSATWIDGLISEERMREEHRLEYELVKDREEEWVWVLPALAARPESESAVPQAEVRAVGVVAAAWGGALAGAAALVLMLPLLALCAWLLNPEENSWALALRLTSLLVIPSAAVGATTSMSMSLRGRPASQSVLTSMIALLGFYLSAFSIWILLAAGLYVLHWFFPILSLTGTVATIGLVLSLILGLVGALWAAGRGPVRARRLFTYPPERQGAKRGGHGNTLEKAPSKRELDEEEENYEKS